MKIKTVIILFPSKLISVLFQRVKVKLFFMESQIQFNSHYYLKKTY